MKKINFLATVTVLAFGLLTQTLAQAQEFSQPSRPQAGFQFVLVVSHQSQDVVFMNEDIIHREFKFGEMTCNAHLQQKKDPVYPSQDLGSLALDCKHGDFPIQVSVACSLLDPAAQSHFEFGEGDQKISFDLLCKAKPR